MVLDGQLDGQLEASSSSRSLILPEHLDEDRIVPEVCEGDAVAGAGDGAGHTAVGEQGQGGGQAWGRGEESYQGPSPKLVTGS